MEPIHFEPIRFVRLSGFQRDRVLDHLLRLDPEDRACRFGRLTDDDDLRRYVARIDWAQTLMLGCEVSGELRAVGELRTIGGGWGADVEAAVTVERPFQGRRIGSELLRRLLTLARNRGVRTVCCICLARNPKVQRMALRHGADLSDYGGELEGRIHLPWPSYLSVAREVMDEYGVAVQTAFASARRAA